MKDLVLISQVFYVNTLLHSGIYKLSEVPEFKDFYIPSEISTGPIDCRLTIMDKNNSVIAYKSIMGPASSLLLSRMLNIQTLLLIKSILQK